MDRDFEGSLMEVNPTHPYNRRQMLTIDDLPDDDLLAIFDFYVVKYQDLDIREVVLKTYMTSYHTRRKIKSWQSLIHVCRRWRCLVFGSPRRLDLQICCATETPAREILDVWPALPLLIHGGLSETSVDNVIAELKNRDRIRTIDLDCHMHRPSQIEKLCTAMQVPFPELEILSLTVRDPLYAPALPDSFLGGSAPRLRILCLTAIPFPALPKLLLSATHLVYLYILHIVHTHYSPEAMATCLSVLTSLEELHIEFNSPQSYPRQESRRPPPSARSVLPALTAFLFKGVNEFLEELVARIDTPRLYGLSTTLFKFNNIDFNAPELNQFISRTSTLGPYDAARLIFCSAEALVWLFQCHPEPSDHRMVQVTISGHRSDRQLSTMARICTLSLCHLLTMENLYIDEGGYSSLDWTDDIGNTEWLNLLLPFTAVKNLHLSKQLLPCIAPALQELTGGRTTEVLPALQNVLLEGFQPSKPVEKGIARFISARQLANHPVAISVWHRNPFW